MRRSQNPAPSALHGPSVTSECVLETRTYIASRDFRVSIDVRGRTHRGLGIVARYTRTYVRATTGVLRRRESQLTSCYIRARLAPTLREARSRSLSSRRDASM